MSYHPAPQDFECFLRGSAASEQIREVIRHLLISCATCRSTLDLMGWTKERLERLLSIMVSDPENLPDQELGVGLNYDESFARAWKACMRELISPLPPSIESATEEDDESARFDDLPASTEDLVPEAQLVQLLIDRSHSARHHDPAKMLYWARLARLTAERCNAESAGGTSQLADLRARAWGQLGNALRVAGRLRDAERALGTAGRHAEEGTGEKLLRLDLLSWRASLATLESRFMNAVTLLDQACDVARELGGGTGLVRCLVSKAIAWVYAGQPEAAIEILDEAIPLIEKDDSRLQFAAFHNLGFCYLEAGKLQEALAILPRTRSLAEDIGDDLVSLRILWQEAKLLCELGMLEEAEAQFSRARDGFADRNLPYEAAVVSLDLSAIHLKLGLSAEVRRTVADVLPIFSGLGVRRELLASLVQLQQAKDLTTALQLIRTISRELLVGPKLPTSI